jgi:hypothetical protein
VTPTERRPSMTVTLDTLLLAGIFAVLLIAAIFDSVTL